MRSIFIFSVVLTAMSLFSCGVNNASTAKKEKFTGSTGAPSWINKVGYKATVFKENSCSANEFGAIPDGKTLNTGAIQNAIDACSKNGEGSVTFQKGIYLTGSLFIKEGIHFKIDKDVEIRGSQDIKDYKQIDTRIAGIEMKWPAALTNVQNRKNVIVDGEGIINGQGKVFWDCYRDFRKQYESKGLAELQGLEMGRTHKIKQG